MRPALGFDAGVLRSQAVSPSLSVFDDGSRDRSATLPSWKTRDLCLVKYSIARNLLLSNSRPPGSNPCCHQDNDISLACW